MTWKLLFHARNGKSDVISTEFFLSKEQNLASEYYAFLDALKTIHGQFYACQFPARYTWLKRKERVPYFDLSKCEELNDFLLGFDASSVNLVLSSESMGAPSSAFGHVMLLFQNRDGLLPSSYVIHYSALPEGQDSFFDYVKNGISGKYPGFYVRESFFKKLNEYNNLEQRYVHLWPLKYDQDEIQFLLFHLFELRKAEFKYYFFQENCSYRLDELIQLPKGKAPKKDILYSLPVATIQRQQDLLQRPLIMTPSGVKARILRSRLNSSEKKDMSQIIKGKAVPSNEMSDQTKEALYQFYNFQFRAENKVLPDYQGVHNLDFSPSEIQGTTPDPLKRAGPSKIGLGGFKDTHTEGMRLVYRPVNNELIDPQMSSSQETELLLMKSEFFLNSDYIHVQRLDFVSLRLLDKSFAHHRPYSWSFLSGINRENMQNRLTFENEIGMGHTLGLGRLTFLAAANVGHDFYSDHSIGYIKPNVIFLYDLSEFAKIGSSYLLKAGHGDFWQSTSFFSLQTGKTVTTLDYTRTNGVMKERFGLLVGYTF